MAELQNMGNVGKSSTLNGVLWSLLSRFGTLSITFIANIVLARQLSPEDFGIVGILMVFVALAGTLLDGGLGTALIQKKHPEERDYSTVFVFNIIVSLLLYAILFLTAPLIAEFYNEERITTILRVQGVVILINAFRVVQYNILIKQLRFKQITITDIGSSLVGAITGIVLATMGFGVWSLVLNNIVYALVFTLSINVVAKWHPSLAFNRDSFRSLFSFGGLILVSNLVDTLYKNVQNLIVGRYFNISELGYYTQAKKLEEVPVQGVSSAVNSVLFPIFSGLQDDKTQLCGRLKRNVDVLSFVIFPIMVTVALVAEPIFEFIYTEKWIASAPLFRLLCVAGMILPVNMINLNIVKSLGKGKIYLALQILQLVVGLAAMFVGLQWGVEGLIWGYIASSYIYCVVIVGVNAKLLGREAWRQLLSICKNMAMALVAAAVVVIALRAVSLGTIATILFGITVGMAVYLSLALLFRASGLMLVWQAVKRK